MAGFPASTQVQLHITHGKDPAPGGSTEQQQNIHFYSCCALCGHELHSLQILFSMMSLCFPTGCFSWPIEQPDFSSTDKYICPWFSRTQQHQTHLTLAAECLVCSQLKTHSNTQHLLVFQRTFMFSHLWYLQNPNHLALIADWRSWTTPKSGLRVSGCEMLM